MTPGMHIALGLVPLYHFARTSTNLLLKAQGRRSAKSLHDSGSRDIRPSPAVASRTLFSATSTALRKPHSSIPFGQSFSQRQFYHLESPPLGDFVRPLPVAEPDPDTDPQPRECWHFLFAVILRPPRG